MRAKVLCCYTLVDEMQKVLPLGIDDIDVEYLPYALHRTPQKLQHELQERIDTDTEHDTFLFGYGLCSHGLVNLHSARHTLVIPRVHDCISLLLGSRDIYDQEFVCFPATVYLSKGWIDQGAEPLAEYNSYRETYGEENAQWLIDTQYSHYQRLVFIDTGVGKQEELKEYAGRVARYIQVKFEKRQGSLRLLSKLVNGQWDREFVVVPPGRMVMQRSFL